MKRVLCLLFLSATLVAGGESDNASEQSEDAVVIRYLVSQGPDFFFSQRIAEAFNESQDRIRVEITNGPRSEVTKLYLLILQTFEAQQDSIDIVPIDTIWPGDFAEHLIDLYPLGSDELTAQMIPELVTNNIIDGRLVAMPTTNTTGLMLYRKDLMQKYGYNSPPRTWDELEMMASAVQQAERAENSDFWGYVWQGQSYETLVCNFLEWAYSNGDDILIDGDRRITLNNQQTVAALERAKSWIGNITPPGVLSFKEEQSRAVFQGGNALFLRSWFYVYGLANLDDSPLKGLVGVSSVPAGDAGHGAATIGSWSTGISRYSKHPEEAFEFVKFLVRYDNTLLRTKILSDFPPYTAAYEDESFLEEVPIMASLTPIFKNSVSRPSRVTAPNYNAISTRIARSVHSILSGRSETEEGLEELALDIQEVTGFEIAN